MNLETLYSIANTGGALTWLPLALVPLRHGWPVRLARVVAFLLAFLYLVLLVSFWGRGEGGFDSLASVAKLFDQPGLLLAGWVHYLVFDLLIGSWEREEASRIGMSQWALGPCLFFTLMFGPVGWLAFLGVRRFKKGSRS